MTGLISSLIPSETATQEKPRAEIVVEGELSPFEHEAFYRILRKGFQTEHPSYGHLLDEEISTRVNIIFHHPYSKELFAEVLREDWRELKELCKQITYRRGKAGAAFAIIFSDPEIRLKFNIGVLQQRDLSSALDQVGHLTGIVRQMLRPEMMERPIRTVEASFDKRSDRWHVFQGTTATGEKYLFDDSLFRWVRG